MAIFFSYSDESGLFHENPTDTQLKDQPYYIRSSFLINSLEWKDLNNDFIELKSNYNIPKDIEIKWQDIWNCRLLRANKRKAENQKESFLKNYDLDQLCNFIEECFDFHQHWIIIR